MRLFTKQFGVDPETAVKRDSLAIHAVALVTFVVVLVLWVGCCGLGVDGRLVVEKCGRLSEKKVVVVVVVVFIVS